MSEYRHPESLFVDSCDYIDPESRLAVQTTLLGQRLNYLSAGANSSFAE
jgi:hypothetical protein